MMICRLFSALQSSGHALCLLGGSRISNPIILNTRITTDHQGALIVLACQKHNNQ